MSKILIVLATTMVAQAAGQTFGGKYLFKVGGAAQISEAPQITSEDLVDGDYTVTCQSLDTSNAPINDLVSGTLSLVGGRIVVPGAPAPTPAPAPDTYPAPASLSFSVVTP